jgi:hypothetical protein
MGAMGRWFGRIVGAAGLVCLAVPAVADDPLRAAVPDLGFTVQVPDRDWTCEHQPDGYRCHPRDNESPSAGFTVTVTEPPNGRLSDADVQGYVQGSVLEARNQGWRPEEPTIEAATIPRAGFHRFTYVSLIPPEGTPFLLIGYVGLDPVGRQVTFTHLAQGTLEPPAFRSFVGSYRWTGNVPPLLEGVEFAYGAGAVVLTMLIGGAGWLANRKAGRVAVNVWKAVLVLLFVAAVGLTGFWSSRLPARLSSLPRAQVYGRVIYGPLALPAAFAAWRAIALTKRRRSSGTELAQSPREESAHARPRA